MPMSLRRPRLSAALLLLAGTALLVFAAAPPAGVPLPGTQPRDGSGDPAFPPFANHAEPGLLDVPGRCSVCHGGYRAPDVAPFEPHDTWAGSLMANAARDPLFWAALDVANQDDAKLGHVGVGDFCLRCHAPKAWYEGRSSCENAWGQPFDGSCLQGTPERNNTDFEGIVCASCHRMYDASQPPEGEFADPRAPYAGNAQIYLSRTPELMFGPFADSVPTGHQFAATPFQRSAALCGQCHDITNPVKNRRDAQSGADLGYRFPIERTYREWQQSEYARAGSRVAATCQACHMPRPDLDADGRADAATACSSPPGPRGTGTELEGPYRTHQFQGANVFMLDLLAGEYGVPLRRTAAYAQARTATLDLLQQRTAELRVSATRLVFSRRYLPVDVRVTNLGGHKFPTGYTEGRRAWLEVAAGIDADRDGSLTEAETNWSSGRYDAASATLLDDPHLKVYEAKHGVFDYNGNGRCDTVDAATGHEMFHFVLNDCVVKDNRIPPRGFRPDAETEPVGARFANDPASGGLANWDDTRYPVWIPARATGSMLVRVRLWHQVVPREYSRFLAAESRSTCDPFDYGCDPTQPDERPNRGEKFAALWEAYGRSEPVLIDEAVVTIDVRPRTQWLHRSGGQQP